MTSFIMVRALLGSRVLVVVRGVSAFVVSSVVVAP